MGNCTSSPKPKKRTATDQMIPPVPLCIECHGPLDASADHDSDGDDEWCGKCAPKVRKRMAKGLGGHVPIYKYGGEEDRGMSVLGRDLGTGV